MDLLSLEYVSMATSHLLASLFSYFSTGYSVTDRAANSRQAFSLPHEIHEHHLEELKE